MCVRVGNKPLSAHRFPGNDAMMHTLVRFAWREGHMQTYSPCEDAWSPVHYVFMHGNIDPLSGFLSHYWDRRPHAHAFHTL